MANGKFWVLMHNRKLVNHKLKFQILRTKSPEYTRNDWHDGYAHFETKREAEKAAQTITKEYGGNVYIMESVALATVPTTIVKIEG